MMGLNDWEYEIINTERRREVLFKVWVVCQYETHSSFITAQTATEAVSIYFKTHRSFLDTKTIFNVRDAKNNRFLFHVKQGISLPVSIN